MPGPLPTIGSLEEITGRYSAILCDVWGVVHNGIHAYSDAVEALRGARDRGLAVVLITNAPRRHDEVEDQLAALGVPAEAWDRVVTSGDITRELVRGGPRKIFHLGLARNLTLYDGLEVEIVPEAEASAIVCTGLMGDDTETPEDYGPMLKRLRARDLPFVCANPDIVVEHGDRLVWCAGALARDYAQIGGRTVFAGKPHRPIYDAALRAASEVLERRVGASQALAIGDGVLTDVTGAARNGVDMLYVSGGIHAHEYGEPLTPDPAELIAFLDRHGHKPVATTPRLR
jgi:HAD superfamily hydrolase (TIGR01459 family)